MGKPKQRAAPLDLKHFDRLAFMDWLEQQGAVLAETTNPYEVVRYRMWDDGPTSRPATHIIYQRGNGTLTYAGVTRQHYLRFLRGE